MSWLFVARGEQPETLAMPKHRALRGDIPFSKGDQREHEK